MCCRQGQSSSRGGKAGRGAGRGKKAGAPADAAARREMMAAAAEARMRALQAATAQQQLWSAPALCFFSVCPAVMWLVCVLAAKLGAKRCQDANPSEVVVRSRCSMLRAVCAASND